MTTLLAADTMHLVPAWAVGVLVFAGFVIALLAVRGVGNGRPHS